MRATRILLTTLFVAFVLFGGTVASTEEGPSQILHQSIPAMHHPKRTSIDRKPVVVNPRDDKAKRTLLSELNADQMARGSSSSKSSPSSIRMIPVEEYPEMPDDLLELLISVVIAGPSSTIFHVNYGGEDLAVKRMKPKDDEMKKRIVTEISVHSAIKSNYIVRFHHMYKRDDFIYFTMDWAPYGDGYDLVDAIHNHYGDIKADVELLARFAIRDVLRALLAIHKRGYVDHDLKWENVLVFLSRLVLTDLGLIVPLEHNRPGQLFGTLSTLPPEVMPSSKKPIYDARGDIWSVGVMLLELLKNVNPFKFYDHDGMNHQETMANIYGIKNVELPDGYSAAAVAFVKRLVCRLENRPKTVEEVLKDPWLAEINGVELTETISPWMDLNAKEPSTKKCQKTLGIIRRKIHENHRNRH